MREYLRNNPLNTEKQEKYCIVAHFFIIAALHAKGIKKGEISYRKYAEESYIDTVYF